MVRRHEPVLALAKPQVDSIGTSPQTQIESPVSSNGSVESPESSPNEDKLKLSKNKPENKRYQRNNRKPLNGQYYSESKYTTRSKKHSASDETMDHHGTENFHDSTKNVGFMNYIVFLYGK